MENKREPIRLITTNENNEQITHYLYLVIGKDIKENEEFIRIVNAENKSKAISYALSLENNERSSDKQLQRYKMHFSVKVKYAELGHESVYYVPGLKY
jgi:hypothetical protein